MIITHITYENLPGSETINGLLKAGIRSDYVFDNCPITLYVSAIANDAEDWTSYFYRRLWETVYIHQDKTIITPIKKTSSDNQYDSTITNIKDYVRIKLRITLSEAISYIYAATPPIRRKEVTQTLGSLDDIVASLRVFLTETNLPTHTHFMNIFKHHIHFEPFDTSWDMGEHAKRMEFLFELNSQKDTNMSPQQNQIRNSQLTSYIMYSSIPIERILENTSDFSDEQAAALMCVFRAKTNEEKYTLALILRDNGFKIDNVHHNGSEVYVRAYSPKAFLEEDNKLMNLFMSSYSAIL